MTLFVCANLVRRERDANISTKIGDYIDATTGAVTNPLERVMNCSPLAVVV